MRLKQSSGLAIITMKIALFCSYFQIFQGEIGRDKRQNTQCNDHGYFKAWMYSTVLVLNVLF